MHGRFTRASRFAGAVLAALLMGLTPAGIDGASAAPTEEARGTWVCVECWSEEDPPGYNYETGGECSEAVPPGWDNCITCVYQPSSRCFNQEGSQSWDPCADDYTCEVNFGEQEAEVLDAVARGDGRQLRDVIDDASEYLTYNPDRKSVQGRDCRGKVLLSVPVSDELANALQDRAP